MLEGKANLSIQNIISQIRALGLSIDITKTEDVLLKNGRSVNEAPVNVENEIIPTTAAIKYISIWLDKGLKIRHTIESSSKGECL